MRQSTTRFLLFIKALVWRNGSSRKSDRFFAEDGILKQSKKYAIKPLGGVFVA
jgi:hypothetical protein